MSDCVCLTPDINILMHVLFVLVCVCFLTSQGFLPQNLVIGVETP